MRPLLTACLQNKRRGCRCVGGGQGTGGCRGSETTNFDFYLREGTPRGRRTGESPRFASGVTQAVSSGAGLRRSAVRTALCWGADGWEMGGWIAGTGGTGETQGAAMSRCRQVPMAMGRPRPFHPAQHHPKGGAPCGPSPRQPSGRAVRDMGSG